MRIAAIADIHARETDDAQRVLDTVCRAAQDADVLVLAGDLTDHGRPAETEVLVRALHEVGIPIVAVLGNHDHEAGHASDILRMLASFGVHSLERSSVVIDGVGFAGAKGFGGGFGRAIVRGFGEDALKTFVSESVIEAEGLRAALKSLSTPSKVAVTHYSPIVETVLGEPVEIHTFLGTSRLANALEEGGAILALHGHAHHGSLEGMTTGGVPVYNVSLPVLRAAGLEARVLDVPAAQPTRLHKSIV